MCAYSSVGRASVLYTLGPWFESKYAHHHYSMDFNKLQEIFDDKYANRIGVEFTEWYETAPNTEAEAYARCQYLDDELKATYDLWFNAQGEDRDAMEDYRERLKSEYDLIEEMFGLELKDK